MMNPLVFCLKGSRLKNTQKTGQATRKGNDFIVNGRTYRYHGDSSNRLIPVDGPGFHQLDRGTYQALGIYNTYGGDTPQARQELDRLRINDSARQAGLNVWRLG